jgi:hypothetical protein
MTTELSPEEAVALALDGQAGANEVALGSQIVVGAVRDVATRDGAERLLVADIEVLVFDTEEDVDQGALVHHEVEAAAGIPAVVARGAVLDAVLDRRGRGAADASDGVAVEFLRLAEAQPPVAKIIQRSQA